MHKGLQFLFLLSTLAFSATVTQTDWSAGAGVAGPVIDWGNHYSTSSHMDVSDAVLKLAKMIMPKASKQLIKDQLFGALAVVAVDIDGDGDMDALGGAHLAHTVFWLENTDGTGNSWEKHEIDNACTGVIALDIADFDGDGDMDALSSALIGNEIAWYENTDGTGSKWTKHSIIKDYIYSWSICAVDINGDGKMDVAGNSADMDDISWWENTNGTGTSWVKHTVDDNFMGGHSITFADVDGDGNMDLLGASSTEYTIEWWSNTDGSGTKWKGFTLDEEFRRASWVYAGDVDSDGDTDILGLEAGGFLVSWCENTDGSGTAWTRHTIDDNFPVAIGGEIVDFDQDGDMDILGLAGNSPSGKKSTIMCWENIGISSPEWERHVLSTEARGLSSISVADINGDGSLDLFGAAFADSAISWWDCFGLSSAVLESSILDAGPVASWDKFDSNFKKPNKTFVSFQFRSSADVANMGAWSEIISSSTGSLSEILAGSTRYIQYRILLRSKKPLVTPTLEDISFTYSYPTGIENGENVWNLVPSANPSRSGCFSVNISVPEAATAELALYDVSGRIISRTSQDFSAGEHSMSFNDLTEGVYFCVMNTDDSSVTKKIVILK